MEKAFDFAVRSDCSMTLLTALTPAAKAFCDTYLPGDCPRLGTAYAIENKYFGDILAGIENEGLTTN